MPPKNDLTIKPLILKPCQTKKHSLVGFNLEFRQIIIIIQKCTSIYDRYILRKKGTYNKSMRTLIQFLYWLY